MYFYTKYSILDICENCSKPGTNKFYILRQVKVILYVETTQQPVEGVALCIYCVIKFLIVSRVYLHHVHSFL